MEKEELSCAVCDSEFAIEHYSEDGVVFCPFCGEELFGDLDEELEDDWSDEDE